MKVLINTSDDSLLPAGSICEVLHIDVERFGSFRPTRDVPEERKSGMTVDMDDEDEIATLDEKDPLPEQEVVRTWFMVANPEGKLRWVDADTVTYLSTQQVAAVNGINEVDSQCKKCKRCGTCGPVVFSNMNWRGKVMVVGQNPGKLEVKKGTPFVGKSGKFFNQCLKEVLGIKRDRLYITNLVKCYTEGNRPPTSTEIDNCWHYLEREVFIVKPRAIVALGALAYKVLAAKCSSISLVQGNWQESKFRGIPLLPLFHPSPLNMNVPLKRGAFKKGLKNLEEYLR